MASMPSFEWGVKAGLNVSGVSNIDDSKMKASIYVGAFAEFHVNDWLGIQPEVIYSRSRNSLLMITVSITPCSSELSEHSGRRLSSMCSTI